MKISAGFLAYRWQGRLVEVLLVHPGGPFWARKDSWSIPKGELDEGEDKLTAAKREFLEEVGVAVPTGELMDLGSDKQGNKTNFIWAVEGDIDVTKFSSNSFTMEWPPKSGQLQEYPENDRAEWFSLEKAHKKIFKGQLVFLARLADQLGAIVPAEPEQQSLL
jgi:predicted NUDIX family NTP pyrophosphohydrolase